MVLIFFNNTSLMKQLIMQNILMTSHMLEMKITSHSLICTIVASEARVQISKILFFIGIHSGLHSVCYKF